MTWAKFDDRYDDNRKIKRAWRASRASIGLHAMAVTYCSRHETDGLVDTEWLEDKLPSKHERSKTIKVLVDAGLFEEVDADHYKVHDYLRYNPSAAKLAEQRAQDAARKAKGRKNGAHAPGGHTDPGPEDSAWIPDGLPEDSARTPDGFQSESDGPVPSRPVPSRPEGPPNPPDGGNWSSPPIAPEGKRERDRAKFEKQLRDYSAWLLPEWAPDDALAAVKDVGTSSNGHLFDNDEVRRRAKARFGRLYDQQEAVA